MRLRVDWETFKEILEWRMCSDPFPGGDMGKIDDWLNYVSECYGFNNWVDAYHSHE